MFKKSVAFLTLVFYLHTLLFQTVAYATDVMTREEFFEQSRRYIQKKTQVQVSKNKTGNYSVNGGLNLSSNFEEVTFMDGHKTVGMLTYIDGHADFMGEANDSFTLSNLSTLKSLSLVLGGSVTFSSGVICQDFLSINAKRKVTFENGFKVLGEKGFATFTGGQIKVNQKGFAPTIQLNSVDSFSIQKDGEISCSAFVSREGLKIFKNQGTFSTDLMAVNAETFINSGHGEVEQAFLTVEDFKNTKNFEAKDLSLSAEFLKNTKRMKLGNAQIDSRKTINTGTVSANKLIAKKGVWHNLPAGHVDVGEYFNGSFETYNDDGVTSVNGISIITAKTGRVTKNFRSRKAVFNFDQTPSFPKKATLEVEDHFALNSKEGIDFRSLLVLKSRQDWGATDFSKIITSLNSRLKPGAYFSSGKDLSIPGTISSNSTSIFYDAKGIYSGSDGRSRSGFFKTNSQIIRSKEALLNGEITSYNDLMLKTKLATLLGERTVKGIFSLDVEEGLFQKDGDRMSVGSLRGKAKNIALSGEIEVSIQLALTALETFTKTRESKIFGEGSSFLKGKRGSIDGVIGTKNSAVETQDDLLIKPAFSSDVSGSSSVESKEGNVEVAGRFSAGESNHFKAKNKIDFKSSGKVNSGKTTAAQARDISTGGDLEAERHLFEGGNSFSNTGRVKSRKNTLVETKYYYNVNGGSISSGESSIINADCLAWSFGGSTFSGKNVEVNTALNLGFGSLFYGSNTVTVNSLFNIGTFGFQSPHTTVNSLVNLSPSLFTGSVPTWESTQKFFYDPEKDWYDQQSFRTGLKLGTSLLDGGTTYTVIKAAELGLMAKDLGVSLYHLVRGIQEEKQENRLRMSRLVKWGGQGLNAAKSAYMIGRGAYDLYCPGPIPDQPVPLWTRAKEFIWEQLAPSVTINSAFNWDKSYGLGISKSTLSVWNYDRSFHFGPSKDTKTIWGNDSSTEYNFRSTTYVVGDYKVTGNKNGRSYLLTTGGNADVEKATLNNKESRIKSEKKATVNQSNVSGNLTVEGKEGAQVLETTVIPSDSDESRNKVFVISESGDASVDGVTADAEFLVESKEGESSVLRSNITGDVTQEGKKKVSFRGNKITGAKRVSLHSSEGEVIANNSTIESETTAIKGKKLYIHFPSINLDGENLLLDGSGLSNISRLYSQEGDYSGLSISNIVDVKTSDHVIFENSSEGAAKQFFLNTDRITVQPNVNLASPEILSLTSKDHLDLGYGANVAAGVFLDLYSTNGQVRGFHQKNEAGSAKKFFKTDSASGCSLGVSYKHVTLLGGSGVEYDYTDPETNVQSTRCVGLRVRSGKGRIHGTGMTFAATTGDIFVEGITGIYNGGDAGRYAWGSSGNNGSEYDIHVDTKFLSGSYTTEGKVILLSPQGDITVPAILINAGDGADVLARENIQFAPLFGKRGHKKKTKYFGLFSSRDKVEGSIDQCSEIGNFGQSKVRIWSQNGDIYAPGLVYHGPGGMLSLRGVNITLERNILDNQFKSFGWGDRFDYNYLNQWRSLQAIQSAADLMKSFGNGDFKEGLTSALDFHVKVGLGYHHDCQNWQSLGQGSILTKDLEVIAEQDFWVGNGYGMSILGDGSIKANRMFQTGAGLRDRSDRKYAGIFGSLANDGPTIGVEGEYQGSKGQTWVPSVIDAQGTMIFDINSLYQDAGIIKAYQSSGRIGQIFSRTRQDTSTSYGGGGSIGWNPVTNEIKPRGHVNGGFYRKANHTSGIFVSHLPINGSLGLQIGQAFSIGADFKNVNIRALSYRDLPIEIDNLGVSFGVSGSFNGKSGDSITSNVGLSYKGHRVGFSKRFALGGSQTQQSRLWSQFGTLTYGNSKVNLEIPIITHFNKEAWTEFAGDLRSAAGSVKRWFDWNAGTSPLVYQQEREIRVRGNSSYPLFEINPALEDLNRNELNALFSDSMPEIDLSGLPRTVVDFGNLIDFEGDLSLIEPSENLPWLGKSNRVYRPSGLADFLDEYPTSSYEDGIFHGLETFVDTLHPSLERKRVYDNLFYEGKYAVPRAFWLSLFGKNEGYVPSSMALGSSPNLPGIRSYAAPSNFSGPLETLFDPLIFKSGGNSYHFGYRVSGTNFYLQDKSLLESVLEAQNILERSPSRYVRKAITAGQNPETAVLIFNSEFIFDGTQGQCFSYDGFKGKSVQGPNGTQTLNGDYVAVGGLETSLDPYSTLSSRLNHEKTHLAQTHYTGGYSRPGYVPNNPSLSQQNSDLLFSAYAQDARALGYTSFSSMPQTVANAGQIEGILMYSAPWQYFENTFRSNLVTNGIYLSEPHIKSILTSVERDLIRGISPSNRYFKRSSVVTDGVGRSLLQAERSMASEIPTFFAEADLRKPGIASEWGNKTHNTLESFERASQTSYSVPSRPRWWQNSAFETGLKYGLPVLDWGFHVISEGLTGHDLPESLGIGTVRTLTDTFAYSTIYGPIAAFGGPVPAIALGALEAGSHFIPDISPEAISNQFSQVQHFAETGDMNGHFWANQEAKTMCSQQALKSVLSVPGKFAQFVFEGVNDCFPALTPNITAFFRIQHEMSQRDALLETVPIYQAKGIELPRHIKTNEEIRAEAMANRDVQIANNIEQKNLRGVKRIARSLILQDRIERENQQIAEREKTLSEMSFMERFNQMIGETNFGPYD